LFLGLKIRLTFHGNIPSFASGSHETYIELGYKRALIRTRVHANAELLLLGLPLIISVSPVRQSRTRRSSHHLLSSQKCHQHMGAGQTPWQFV
jgi:hypothetical protein